MLLQIHPQHIYRNGCPLGHSKLVTNQAQPETPVALSGLAIDVMSLAVVIDELLILGDRQLGLVLEASEKRTA